MTPAQAAELIRRYDLSARDLVVEIGSGDGTFLRSIRECGPRVLGIEPDVRIMARAFHAGIDTFAGFFCPSTADYVRRRYGEARVLIAKPREVSGDDRGRFLFAAAKCLSSDGVIVLLASGIVHAELRPLSASSSRAA